MSSTLDDVEIKNFIKVWITVMVSLSYCHTISRIAPKGLPRLLTIVPIACLFLALPLSLTTMHLGGISAFFIAWLSSFKVLLFAFDLGPLSTPSISLPHFVAVGCFPIKVQHDVDHFPIKVQPNKKLLNYAVKLVLLVMLLRAYGYSDRIPDKVLMIFYCFHLYFFLEILLAAIAAVVRAALGLEFEPQFNEPYLSTSLQDFWGRRWNLMVTSILRPTVYNPVLQFSAKRVGRRWAPLPAVLSTFVVSSVMHELIFYYMGRVWPTGGVSLFFLLHGVCLTAEIGLKKVIDGRRRLHPLVSGLLTVGFVMTTGLWLFVPQLIKCRADERAFAEVAVVCEYVRDTYQTLTLKYFGKQV